MRLVDVKEKEEGPNPVLGNPLLGDLLGFKTRPLQASQAYSRLSDFDRIVVELKASRDPGSFGEDDCGDGPARRVAGLTKGLGQSRLGGVEYVTGVVPHAVLEGQETGEQSRVGRQSQRDVAVGVLEKDTVASQRIDRRCLDPRITVSGKMIGSQGIDRDQDDRRPRKDATAATVRECTRQKCEKCVQHRSPSPGNSSAHLSRKKKPPPRARDGGRS